MDKKNKVEISISKKDREFFQEILKIDKNSQILDKTNKVYYIVKVFLYRPVYAENILIEDEETKEKIYILITNFNLNAMFITLKLDP